AERIGVGVSSEAHIIFDALSKTLPVHWDKTVIVVMNEVRVSSPYHSECVIDGTPAANDRVKKVLEFEIKRLQLRVIFASEVDMYEFFVKITDEMKAFKAYYKLRLERINKRHLGARLKRAAEAEKEDNKK
ncbi:hypothetical protein RYX36_026297, partial [Vicia faba]